ncbi:MAG: hypothetical protein K2X66_18910 [Cyanobacteria bacterium]|nr:hypothetical protein [Cyanobacteriota bacterium]
MVRPIARYAAVPQLHPLQSFLSGAPSQNSVDVPSFLPTSLEGSPSTAVKISPSATLPRAQSPRHIYVLHSGMRDPGNEAAESIKQGLLKRGVPEGDIITMPPVYPEMNTNPLSLGVGRGVSENLSIYRESSQLDSKVSQKAHQNLLKLLKENGVSPQDKLHWVGHSAGGQMGLTLSGRLDRDNKKLSNTPGFQFDSIITTGSPIATNSAPPEVKIRHYTSESDTIQHGSLLGGLVGKPIPDNMDGNDVVRHFNQIGHLDWYKDKDTAVFDKIIQDTQGDIQRGGQNNATPHWAYRAQSLNFGDRFSGQFLPGQPVGGASRMQGHQNTFGKSFEQNKGVSVPDNATNVHIFGEEVSLIDRGLKIWNGIKSGFQWLKSFFMG